MGSFLRGPLLSPDFLNSWLIFAGCFYDANGHLTDKLDVFSEPYCHTCETSAAGGVAVAQSGCRLPAVSSPRGELLTSPLCVSFPICKTRI